MIAIMSQPVFDALMAASSQPKQYDRGAHVFHRGDRVQHVYLLAAGSVRLTRFLGGGEPVILHRAQAPHVIAEASIYSHAYHCDCICEQHSLVHALPIATASAILDNDPALAREWSAYLARELQSARRRCELLTHRTVSEKLNAWLDWRGDVPAKGQWKSLAAELNVTPEALYRELARRGARPENSQAAKKPE